MYHLGGGGNVVSGGACSSGGGCTVPKAIGVAICSNVVGVSLELEAGRGFGRALHLGAKAQTSGLVSSGSSTSIAVVPLSTMFPTSVAELSGTTVSNGAAAGFQSLKRNCAFSASEILHEGVNL